MKKRKFPSPKRRRRVYPAGLTARGRRLHDRYGITEREYELIFEFQNGGCGICGRPPRKVRLNVDHDHKKKGRASVRGLLCAGRYRGCNRLLGRVDDQYWLMRATEYLQSPPAQAILFAQRAGLPS